MATLKELIEKTAKTYTNQLTQDQVRDIKGRLRFAGVDEQDVKPDEVKLVMDTVIAVAKTSKPVEKSAAMNSCPRCHSPMNPVKLADGTQATVCGNCRVVAPS